MKMMIIRLLLVSAVLLPLGCFEDKCKNPKQTEETERKTGLLIKGPAIQCNVVLLCQGMAGRPDSRNPLASLVDPVIVDRHSRSDNRDSCRQTAIDRELVPPHCKVDASPELICLDANGAAGGPSPTGDVIVTVGAGPGAGSGDFHFDDDEGAPGADGAGGYSAASGDGGQGGI